MRTVIMALSALCGIGIIILSVGVIIDFGNLRQLSNDINALDEWIK